MRISALIYVYHAIDCTIHEEDQLLWRQMEILKKDPRMRTRKIPEAEPVTRSWKMSDETKRRVAVEYSPDEQASLLKRIAETEEKRKMRSISRCRASMGS